MNECFSTDFSTDIDGSLRSSSALLSHKQVPADQVPVPSLHKEATYATEEGEPANELKQLKYPKFLELLRLHMPLVIRNDESTSDLVDDHRCLHPHQDCRVPAELERQSKIITDQSTVMMPRLHPLTENIFTAGESSLLLPRNEKSSPVSATNILNMACTLNNKKKEIFTSSRAKVNNTSMDAHLRPDNDPKVRQ